jgi:hypothetical protein
MAQLGINVVLIVDTEGCAELREVGAILYHLDYGIVKQFSTLIRHDMTPAMEMYKGIGDVDYAQRRHASLIMDEKSTENILCFFWKAIMKEC